MANIYRLKVLSCVKNIEESIVIDIGKGKDKICKHVLYFLPNILDENVRKSLGEKKVKDIENVILSIHKTGKAKVDLAYDLYAQCLTKAETDIVEKCWTTYAKSSNRVNLAQFVQKNVSPPKDGKRSHRGLFSRISHKTKK